MNESMAGTGYVGLEFPYNNLPVYANVMNGTFELPVTPDQLCFHLARTGVHEACHMFGLVANNNVLGGTAGHHNPAPNGTRVMDDGETVVYEKRFKRAGDWEWRELNKKYLEFILPKKEKPKP
jgi:hypothetical protein